MAQEWDSRYGSFEEFLSKVKGVSKNMLCSPDFKPPLIVFSLDILEDFYSQAPGVDVRCYERR